MQVSRFILIMCISYRILFLEVDFESSRPVHMQVEPLPLILHISKSNTFL